MTFVSAWLTLIALVLGICAGITDSVNAMWAYLALGLLLVLINGVFGHVMTVVALKLMHKDVGIRVKEPPFTMDQFLAAASRLHADPVTVLGLNLYVANPGLQRVGGVFCAQLEGHSALVIEAIANEETHGQDEQ